MRDELLNETLFTRLAHGHEALPLGRTITTPSGPTLPSVTQPRLRIRLGSDWPHRGRLQPSPMMATTGAGLWSPLDERRGSRVWTAPLMQEVFEEIWRQVRLRSCFRPVGAAQRPLAQMGFASGAQTSERPLLAV